MKKTIFPLLAALSFAACTDTAPQSVAKLSNNPTVSGGTFTTGGGITIAADMREKGGKTQICGVRAESHQTPANLKGAGPQIVSSGAVFVGSERVAHNLLFMRKVEPQHRYGGLEAHCQTTARPWQAGDANRKPAIQIPEQIVRHTKGGVSVGQIVYFKPTGPGAGSPDLKRQAPREPITESVASQK